MATRIVELIVRVRDAASPAFSRIGNAAKTLTTLVGIGSATAIGFTLVRAIRSAISAGADFEQEMSAVGAITQATASEMRDLSAAAKEMGVTTVFSAGQAATAQRALGQAGLEVAKIIEALPATLKLAAAGEIELGRAAEFAASITKGLNREFSQLDETVDVLAFTATNANTDITGMATSLSLASTSASLLNIDIREVSAAIGILADRGIEASRIGSGLNRGFAILAGQTEEGEKGLKGFNVQLFDSAGKFVGLAEAIRRMNAAGIRGKDAFDIFGTRAGQAFAILLELGPQAIEQFVGDMDLAFASMQNVGDFAAEIMARKLDNLRGDVTLLASAWEGLSITLFEKGTPAMRAVVKELTEVVRATQEAGEASSNLQTIVTGAITGIADVIILAVEAVRGFTIAWGLARIGISNAIIGISTALLTWNELQLASLKIFNNFVGGAFDELVRKGEQQVETLRAFVTNLEGFSRRQADSTAAAIAAETALLERLRAVKQAALDAAEAAKKAADDQKTKTDADEESTDAVEDNTAALDREKRALDALSRAMIDAGFISQGTADEMSEAFADMFEASGKANVPMQQFLLATADGLIELIRLAKKSGADVPLAIREMAAAAAEAASEESIADRLKGVIAPTTELPDFEPPEVDIDLPTDELIAYGREALRAARAQEALNTQLDFAQTAANAFSRAFVSSVAAAAESGKGLVDIARQVAAAVIDALAQEALVQAAKQVALAITALATQNYGAAARHFAAAAAWTAVSAAAAVGAASIARSGGSEESQGFASGGMAQGRGGVDSVSAFLTPGELIVDTTPAEARAVLSGRAKIVPAGEAGGRMRAPVENWHVSISAADSRSVRDMLVSERNLIRTLRKLQRLGKLRVSA